MIYKRIVIFFLFFSIFFPQIESISSNVTLGQDSNPMKLSKDEFDESNMLLFTLSDMNQDYNINIQDLIEIINRILEI